MRLWALYTVLLVGCNFDGSTASRLVNNDGGGIDADPNSSDARTFVDAEPMADAVASCITGDTFCFGDSLEVCNEAGDGTVQTELCDFACVDNDHCIGTSNLSGTQTDICDQIGTSLPLAPASSATITIANNEGSVEIQCSPDCGDGSTTVIPTSALLLSDTPALAMFCLSVLDLVPGANITVADNVPHAIALVVQSNARIASEIRFSGREYLPLASDIADISGSTAGAAGPGGGRGGALNLGLAPVDGQGSCPGQGGETGGASDDHIGGGGGGGSYGGLGGQGGEGQSSNNGDLAAGGSGGASCGSPADLQPIRGGSGGGSGGDGKGTTTLGWPGGGGGGALQISARDFIEFSGRILANGGNGNDGGSTNPGGGGGGGSGGAVLLEAPILTISGVIEVEGGDGGDGSAGNGGVGGKTVNADGTDGTSQNGSDESGGGGGGGGGRVRLNAASAPTCTNVSPTAACSAGLMPLQ